MGSGEQLDVLMNRVFSFLVDHVSIGIHVVDRTGKTVIYNRKMSEIESMPMEEVLHKNVSHLFAFSQEQESTLLRALAEGKTTTDVKQSYFNKHGKQITSVNSTYPLYENDEIIGAIEIATDVTQLEKVKSENAKTKEPRRHTFQDIVGESQAIKEAIEVARRAARTSSSILIIGETGTGKEMFAQSIHYESERAAKPFLSQNCAALPDHLVEAILFGTKRGAFTGAIDRPGLFELADGGTLFLDELDSLSLTLQAKLLRVIQEKTVRRIGDTKDQRFDVRLLATISMDPIEAIASNVLRKDLYYRLGVVNLFIPPLRERAEDIPVLLQHFIGVYNQLFGMKVTGMEESLHQQLLAYEWPGNVRELQHVVEGAMNLIVQETMITAKHIPAHLKRYVQRAGGKDEPDIRVLEDQPSAVLAEIKSSYQQHEREQVEEVLRKTGYHITRAAELLGMSRQSLQYRMKKYGIEKKK
ncbi:MAG TPA: sigma 54-interacting transcriptional regulator [Candidatus Bathyarchaeia archaeon]|nr:sigma 54-interacting transcriptional regulator [Candidatus Bathyarchaeia archaeon]